MSSDIIERETQRLWQLAAALLHSCSKLCIKYFEWTNDLTIPRRDETLFRMRDSMFHRARALWNHVVLMTAEQRKYTAYVSEGFPASLDDHDAAMAAASMQLSLFEDVVFHTCSLFDYLAKLIAFVYGIRDWRGKEWPKIYGCARATSSAITDSELRDSVVSEHQDWLSGLYEYRSRAIHNEMSSLSHTLKISPGKGGLAISSQMPIPQQFRKAVTSFPRISAGEQEIFVQFGAFIIAERAVRTALHMTDLVTSDLSARLSKLASDEPERTR